MCNLFVHVEIRSARARKSHARAFQLPLSEHADVGGGAFCRDLY